MESLRVYLTARDHELLRYEYEEGVKAKLKIIFFKFENAPIDRWTEFRIEKAKELLDQLDSSSHLSMSITI